MGRLDVRDELAPSSRRQSVFCQNVLQDVFVQAQVGNQLFQLSVLILELLQAPQFADTQTADRRTPSSNGRTSALKSIRRIASATGVPVSACFNAKAICSSVYLDFFISSSLPEGFTRPENSRSKWTNKQGGRQDVAAHLNADRGSAS